MTSSRAERARRATTTLALVLFLLSPYVLWITRLRHWNTPAASTWGPLVLRSLLQASASLIVSALAGWVLFRGLRALGADARARGEWRLLLPNVVPSLFLALAMIGLVTPWTRFPFGLGAVVAAHAWLNAGLIAVALERIERARLGNLAEAAWVMGVRERDFWWRIAWPVARREVGSLLFFVFSLSFTSFSLPLLLQGSRDVTLEVAIYDLIRIDGRWDQAVTLAAGQMGALLIAALCLPHALAVPRTPEPRTLPYRPRRAFGLVTWIPLGLLVAGWGGGLVGAVGQVRSDWTAVAPALLTTAGLGAAVAFAHLILFMVVAYASPNRWLERFLLGYLAPGPAITGFALLIGWPGAAGETTQLIRLTVALTLLSFAPLYRWQVHAAIGALTEQRLVARTLGASAFKIFTDVTWPQAGPAILNAAGLAAVWAAGDFAVSGLLLDHAITLPQLIAEYLGHYQWARAQLLLIPLGLVATVLYHSYRMMGRYARRSTCP